MKGIINVVNIQSKNRSILCGDSLMSNLVTSEQQVDCKMFYRISNLILYRLPYEPIAACIDFIFKFLYFKHNLIMIIYQFIIQSMFLGQLLRIKQYIVLKVHKRMLKQILIKRKRFGRIPYFLAIDKLFPWKNLEIFPRDLFCDRVY